MTDATGTLPDEINPHPWQALAAQATPAQVRAALACETPAEAELAALLSPAGTAFLEPMAQAAQALTRQRFGRTMQLYVPLYLSNLCSGGCAYCGYAADRSVSRRRLTLEEAETEMQALAGQGYEEVLLLTGERCDEAGFEYVRQAVALAARHFHLVTVEVFPMTVEEYAGLAAAGCTGVTLYQETYDPARYRDLHRWGPKADFDGRLEAPARALAGGIRTVGLGALLGLGDPCFDILALYRHGVALRRRFWRAGISLSFPRLRPEGGGFQPSAAVQPSWLAQAIFALRLVLPDVPLTLSTRESAAFRDGMAGVGINRMSVGSRTTVGGYHAAAAAGDTGQFEIGDNRGMASFRAMLEARGLQPVLKNWDAAFR